MKTFEIHFVYIIFAMEALLAACNDDILNKFYNEMLELHNKYRRIHNANDLIYDDELSNMARTCKALDKLIGSNEVHDMIITGDICYSVYKSMDLSKETAEDVFMMWYNQGKDYNYVESRSESGIYPGHFRQIVWRDTTHVGFTMLEKSGKTWFVAAYSPAGNDPFNYIINMEEPTNIVV